MERGECGFNLFNLFFFFFEIELRDGRKEDEIGERQIRNSFTYVTSIEQRPELLRRVESGFMVLSPGFQSPILSFCVQHVANFGSGQGLCIGTS